MMRRRDFLATLSAIPVAVTASSDLYLEPSSTVIVTSDNPHEQEVQAASLLQEYLRKVSRSKGGFYIVSETKAPSSTIALIAVGRTRWAPEARLAELHQDGFVIWRSGRRVVIAGSSPAGTFYGASRFLDRFCGVRFYMPGELFTVIPAGREITLPHIDVVEEPFVTMCMMSGVGGDAGTGGSTGFNPRPQEKEWLDRNAAYRKEPFSDEHTMYQRFPPERFAQKYPQIYPILNGKRYIPDNSKDQDWQPCFTEPTLVDAGEESVLEYFRAQPSLHYIAFSIQDSHCFCQCPRCLNEVERHYGNVVAAYTDMNAAFLNNLAKRLRTSLPAHGMKADKTIVYLAYSDVRFVPSFPIDRDLLPIVVFKISDILNDKELAPDPKDNLFDEWASAVKWIGQDDWGEGMGYFIPRYYVGLTSRVLRYAKSKGLMWAYQHFEAYPNWGFDGPRLYITSRLWWDPDLDLNQLWRQLCADLFPGAHGPMHQYFMTMESLWVALDSTAERKIRKWSTQFKLDPGQREIVSRGRQLLNKALQKATSDQERQRIDLFSKTYRLAEQFFDLANANKVDPATIEQLRAYARDVIAPDPMTVYFAGDSAKLTESVNSTIEVITKGKAVV